MSDARIELTTRALRDLRKHTPYLRLRVGDWRVLYRPTTEQEAVAGGEGWFVFRIVNRRDLERAARTL